MNKVVIISALLLTLSGCATPYAKNGLAGGYSDLQLSANTFKVSFQGNGFTNPSRAADFALLRSAEVALEHGFKYFVIVDSEQDAQRILTQMPGSSTTTMSTYGNTTYARTQHHPGMPMMMNFPRAKHVVVCFKENPDGHFLEADLVAQSIRSEYKIKAKK